ncbi:hypothetical protein bAD24_p01560 (plasmid) [Burkholderia sp. AD24]|nr:hypothetical protein bAD24_p01560 [Burkholderia sp. AD24]
MMFADKNNATGRTAAPIDRVKPQADCRVTFDGRDLSSLIAPPLISLSISDWAATKPTCSISLTRKTTSRFRSAALK